MIPINRLTVSSDKIRGNTIFVEDAMKNVSTGYTGTDVTQLTEPVFVDSKTLLVQSNATGDASVITNTDENLITFTQTSTIPNSDGIIWNAVSWSAELKILVAVGFDNKISVSYDLGTTWNTTTITNTKIGLVDWYDIIWADTLMSFVIVGTTTAGNAVIAYSNWDTNSNSNSLSWTIRLLMSNSYIFSISWSSELRRLVAVGYGIDSQTNTQFGVMLTNIGGSLTSWNRMEYNTDILQKVIWIPELSIYVAVSKDILLASGSGLPNSWIDSELIGDWYNISWASELSAIILSDGTNIAFSSDLTNWTTDNFNNINTNINYINWNARLGRFILTSDTGVDISIPVNPTYNNILKVTDDFSSISIGNVFISSNCNFYKGAGVYTPTVNLETNVASLWSKTSGNLIYTKGNIAIGKTTTNYTLDVNGITSAEHFTGGSARFSSDINIAGKSHLSGNSLRFGNSFTFSNGNVHIGTVDTSNTNKLDIAGNLGVQSNIETNLSTSNIGSNNVRFGELWSDNVNLGSNLFIGEDIITNSSGNLTTNQTPVSNLLVVGDTVLSGNVGIGTTDPSAKLDVVGDVIVRDTLNILSGTIGNVFATGGNFGIGTTTPNTKIDVVGDITVRESLNTLLDNNANDNATIGNVFATGGNFGIGITTPSAKLEVVGNISISGTTNINRTSLRYTSAGSLQISGDPNFTTNINGELQQGGVRAGKMTKIAAGASHSLALDYFTGTNVQSRGVSAWGSNTSSLKHPSVPLTSNSTNLYEASASSVSAINTQAFSAFDFNFDTQYSSDFNTYNPSGSYKGNVTTQTNNGEYRGEWLGLRLKQDSTILKSISISSYSNSIPKEVIILGSNEINPSSWNVITTIGDLSNNIFTFANTTVYNNYRFVFTSKITDPIMDIIDIRELVLNPVPITIPSSIDDTLAQLSVINIAAGDSHSLALDALGRVYSWGLNTTGQLGNGSTVQQPTTIVVTGGGLLNAQVIALAGGSDFSLAVDSLGQVYSWGENTSGQLGNGSTTQQTTPITVTGGSLLGPVPVVSVAAGTARAVALDTAGRVHAWGATLGDSQTTPVLVTNGSLVGVNVYMVECGSAHQVALDISGRVHAWGSNASGQLGNGSTTDSPLPIIVTGGTLLGRYITTIAAGGSHTLALDSTGRVHAWGSNASGQLGNNSTTDAPLPIMVTGGSLSAVRVASIAAGGNFSLAVDSLGQIHAWGANDFGQLGDGSTTQRTLPVLLSTPTLNFTAQHNCIIDTSSINFETDLAGLIVVADKNTYSYANTEHKSLIGINQALPVLSLSKTPKDKRVFGVVSTHSEGTVNWFLESDNANGASLFKPINGIGEGAIWVTDENGPLEAGDYITSSSVPGYGMRQDEPYMCNYTVAKITSACDFNKTNGIDTTRYIKKDGTLITEQITEHNLKDIFIAKFVGCTYHCG